MSAQPAPPRSEDVESIEGLMTAAYQAVSARPGGERDLARFRSLFRPDATLLAVARDREGVSRAQSLTLDDFARTFAGIVTDGVFEREISRSVRSFGDIAQLWSSYEVSTAPGAEVRVRGINSLELVFERGRWWITGGQFQNESEGVTIPAELGGAEP